jgi:hypothetical protein
MSRHIAASSDHQQAVAWLDLLRDMREQIARRDWDEEDD